MISIRDSVNELEQAYQERTIALDCYLTALRNLARYAIDLDPEITEPHKTYLGALAEEVASGKSEVLEGSRPALRGLLRDYRDKAAHYLSGLREQVATTTRALEELLDSLSQSDSDHESQVRGALASLRAGSASSDLGVIRRAISSAADTIEQSVDQIRKHHQLSMAQFQMEIGILHKRIDTLEAATRLDSLTRLFSRGEMEERIRGSREGGCLLLVKADGFRRAEMHFPPEVAADLIASFTKRLRNCLPPTAQIGRWCFEGFTALLFVPHLEATATAKRVAEQLSGTYSCMLAGKAVRPQIQVNVAVLECGGEPIDRTLQRVSGFLNTE